MKKLKFITNKFIEDKSLGNINIISFLGLLLTLPIFIYPDSMGLSLAACTSVNFCTISISIGSIFLILISIYFLIINKILFFFSFFVICFSIEFINYSDLELLIRVLKSLMPFIFFLSFISIKNKIKLNNNELNKIFTQIIPGLIIIYQILIILFKTELVRYEFFFLPEITLFEFEPYLFANYFKVYNYNQYFSFILVFVCGVRLFLKINNFERYFHILFIIYSCLHANNLTALICGIIIIIFSTLNNFLQKNKYNEQNLKLISFFFISMFIAIPFFSKFILSLGLEDLDNERIYQLITRLVRYSIFFENFDFLFLFNGIFPEPFFINQMHNQLLEYFSYFGVLKTFFLIFILIVIYRKIEKIYYIFPMSVIIGLGGGLNEIFTHWYTGQIIFFYLVFCSNYKIKF
jgi:hypothetical protein